MKPNPDIALIYHYDLARALAGEVVDWQAIPVNVQAGREGGDLCRQAADFGKRRDLFAMPAPTTSYYLRPDTLEDDIIAVPASFPKSDGGQEMWQCSRCNLVMRFNQPQKWVEHDCIGDGTLSRQSWRLNKIAVPVPVPNAAVEQPAVDPRPDTASPPVAVSAADRPIYVRQRGKWDRLSLPQDRDRLRARIKDLCDAGHEQRLRIAWPDGVPTLRHQGHTPAQLEQILAAVRRVEAEVGAGWHPDDSPEPRSAKAIRRALDAWAGRDPGTAWFAASLIATFEQCRNADSTFEDLVSQFTIEQADRLHDAAQGITP